MKNLRFSFNHRQISWLTTTSRLFHADTFAFTEDGFLIKPVGLSYRFLSITQNHVEKETGCISKLMMWDLRRISEWQDSPLALLAQILQVNIQVNIMLHPITHIQHPETLYIAFVYLCLNPVMHFNEHTNMYPLQDDITGGLHNTRARRDGELLAVCRRCRCLQLCWAWDQRRERFHLTKQLVSASAE